MPYNTNNQRNNAQFDVNTNSLMLFSGNVCLRMDLYNKNMQLSMIQAVQTADGKNTYPKENGIRVLLTPDRVQALVTLIVDRLIPALEARRSFEGSIITNNRMSNIVLVGCDQTGNAYMDLYTGMDERRIPAQSVRYIFPKIPTLSKYNSQTGEYEQGPDIHAHLYLLSRCMEDFLFNSSMAAVHTYRIMENSHNRRLMNLLQEIATKLGIPIQRSGDGQGGYRYGGNNGGNMPINSQPAQTTNTTTLDNIDSPDLPF